MKRKPNGPKNAPDRSVAQSIPAVSGGQPSPAEKTRRLAERDPKLLALVSENERLQAEIKNQLAAALQPYELDSYSDVASAMEGISRRPPAAILVDLGMSREHAVDCLRRIKTRFPHLSLIALTPAHDPDAILLALMAGALGCLVQPPAAEDLIRAIDEVLKGRVCLCHNAQSRLVHSLSPIAVTMLGGAPLSPREQQIVAALLQHRTN